MIDELITGLCSLASSDSARENLPQYTTTPLVFLHETTLQNDDQRGL
jgi:hypothetical protein